jgi:hypothetical protein
MPTGCRSYKTQHYATSATNGLGIVGTGTLDASLRYRNGSAGATWVSITGPAIISEDAWNNNPWVLYNANTNFINGWIGFQSGTDYLPGLAELRRGDGMSITHGMLANGSLNSAYRFLIDENIPGRSRILHIAAGDGRGRMDIHGHFDYGFLAGELWASQGSTSWQALDSLKWVP